MNDKRIPLQGTLEKWWNLWLHWQFMYRTIGEDRVGNLTYVWECDKSAHRNDYALAQCYWRVGIDRFAENQSYFEGGKNPLSELIPDAPYRQEDGTMVGNAIKITMPEVNTKESDWKYH